MSGFFTPYGWNAGDAVSVGEREEFLRLLDPVSGFIRKFYLGNCLRRPEVAE